MHVDPLYPVSAGLVRGVNYHLLYKLPQDCRCQFSGLGVLLYNFQKALNIDGLLRETYGSKIKVFGTEIPHSVRAKETSAEGRSIFAHDPGGKVAEGYANLTKEVLKLEKQREKSRAGIGR